MDLFVVPTISFQLLYGLLILRHGRREILWLATTTHPNAEWISRRLIEAYGWEQGPRYLVRDRDSVYGDVFIRHLRWHHPRFRRDFDVTATAGQTAFGAFAALALNFNAQD